MRNFTKTLAYWTPGKALDEPIETCMRLNRERFQLQKADWIPLVVTTKWFLQVLTHASPQSVSSSNSNAAMGLVKSIMQLDEDCCEYSLSELKLTHPTHPCPDRLLAYIRMSENHPGRKAYVEKSTRSGSPIVLLRLRMILMRLAQACENLGRSEDARWVLDYGLRKIPGYFTFREPVTGPRNTAPVP